MKAVLMPVKGKAANSFNEVLKNRVLVKSFLLNSEN